MSELEYILKNKVMEISFYWKSLECESFRQDEKCKGTILVNKDGTFEGIVKEKGTESPEHFVFGILIDGVVVELYDLSILDFPYRFIGLNDGENYEGSFYGIVGENRDGLELGSAKIEIRSLELPLEQIKSTMINLYEKTNRWKEHMGSTNSDLYAQETSRCSERYRELLKEFECQVQPKRFTIKPVDPEE